MELILSEWKQVNGRGQAMTTDGRTNTAMRQRIEIVRQSFLNMSDIFKERTLRSRQKSAEPDASLCAVNTFICR